jgi:NitT/TauT family transport system substrate-binding protein
MKSNAGSALRRWGLLLAVAMLATLVVACGGDSPSASSSDGGGGDAPKSDAPKELRKVTAQFTFIARGEYAHLFLADEKGFFAEEGLEVDFKEGKGAVFESVASRGGQDVFLISTVNQVTESVTNGGLPMISVATWEPKSASVFASRPGTPIRTPKDLEGKTIGVKQGLSMDLMLATFFKRNDIDPKKVKVRQLDPAAANTVFIGGDVDAIDAFVTNEVPILEAQAKEELVTLPVADNGVPELGIGVVVTNDFLEGDPELVRGFLRAAHRGVEEMKKDPAAAAAAIKNSKFEKALPDLPIIEKQVANTIELMPEPAGGHMYGWAEESAWQTMADHQKESGVIKKDVLPMDKYFTNDYLE